MTPPPSFPDMFVAPWRRRLLDAYDAHVVDHDRPSFYLADPDALVSTATLHTLATGTGHALFQHELLPALARAQREIVFVTCFWNASPTLTDLGKTLSSLAADRRQALDAPLAGCGGASADGMDEDRVPSTASGSLSVLNVYIGLSVLSKWQMLFRSGGRQGRVHRAKEWPGLGLPDAATLAAARIRLTVKSQFYLPLSVMHPKFMVVDRRAAWLPSCNVSWERWFETSVEVTGPILGPLLAFYRETWDDAFPSTLNPTDGRRRREATATATASYLLSKLDVTSHPVDQQQQQQQQQPQGHPQGPRACPAILLPSPHHRNPRFRLWGRSPPPPTPLNVAVLTLCRIAKRHVEMLTPNLTSLPVMDALLDVLARGVDVTIRTNEAMMVLEQLITTGTTTHRQVQALIRRYSRMRGRTLGGSAERRMEEGRAPLAAVTNMDANVGGTMDANGHEAMPSDGVGRLRVYYYTPVAGGEEGPYEPVVAHAKVTIVDDEFVLLGSGNQDRASWYTSQELGLLVHAPHLDWQVWRGPLASRQKQVYPSTVL